MSFIQWLIGGGVGSIVALLTWWTTSRATVRTHESDSVKHAMGAWQEMADDLRAEIAGLKSDLKEVQARCDNLENDRHKLAEENRRLRAVLGDAMRYLRQMAEWERSGTPPPPPLSAETILVRLLVIAEGLIE